MRRLCEDVVRGLPEFAHVRMEQVAVSFAQARSRVHWGLQAKLTPLRFEGGSLTTCRRGRPYTIERWHAGEIELLYVLTFYLPRFLDQTYREKLITVMHELHHISPRFDGDIRRLPGHFHVHSHSQRHYDQKMDRLVDRWLARNPPDGLHAFLRCNFRELLAHYGRVEGMRVRMPRLLPLAQTA
ncbi:MAG: hypothetical protein ACT4QC_05290 [Planctomycetaceae bacterium]